MKEKTIIAANDLSLPEQPLAARWLERAARSDSAVPLLQPIYHREKLTPALLTVAARASAIQRVGKIKIVAADVRRL